MYIYFAVFSYVLCVKGSRSAFFFFCLRGRLQRALHNFVTGRPGFGFGFICQ